MSTHLENPPVLLGILEAAALARVSRSFLYERLADGSIESRKAGRRRLVVSSSLNHWMTNLPVVALKQAPSKEAASA
jgi:excisionase family DNA binding protein